MESCQITIFILHNQWISPLGLLYPAVEELDPIYIYPRFLLGPDLNLSSYVVNIEEESEVHRTPAPKTVHILYTTIIFM